ncbi:cell division protein FtsZ [Shewanella pneumatophori]|uniref:Cell division protein FtsZ n=1 Tax=Shewanella pneumatophori TaxID=314092 RepID=A0A9X1ZJZ7_9GAMM|nr:cell division protein FtsZ [Shewanella pneumatophori]MCL1139183.1 cell division protein FtsZ [Shewanella pneumatophori]
MFDLVSPNQHAPRIAVFGVGGCGCNTINQLSQSALHENVELIAVNTDAQSLMISQCSIRLQIGLEVTKGLGAGASPEKGCQAAKESEVILKEHIERADIIFITGGMGGGTGTGAIPFIAEVAAELNKPLVAVVTTPFSFEGQNRSALAQAGVEQLMQHSNAVIVLPNDKLMEALDKKIRLINAFFESNRVLQDVLQGLTTTISQSGLINIDLNDFIAVISHQGRAAMGVARQLEGEELQLTISNALKNPLQENVDLTQAKGAIVSVIATENIELSQYHKIGETLHQQLAPGAFVIIGLTIVPELDCELELMVIATGIQAQANMADNNVNTHEVISETDTTESMVKPRFVSSELVNVHDFLKQKAISSPAANPLPGNKGEHATSVLEIPTYTRRQQVNEP